ncbi:MAG: hypothetical protein COV91_02880 [Candidatus Taylorbacteria bacterium CG11_big_fil_rev_8_21_14_0_20_46_11]|uniref:Uncharacterized protein n=1 Tax=Candidatus Taylorbacteria bacterium CG11_big_fil_rev_8_21_14_0_20_46_11 TaxID=1975025 RepID=A0A2H0KBP9_9BACT|nr:MAG: hypothetical protein COV91_02880 [Candidatus Taylorbacteria bacterium CG11_big_fil_rev_8_21_14_0_20_46_11]
MTTVTIPKEFSNVAELIAVPPFVYEDYTAIQKKVKNAKTFTPTVADKKAIARARANFKKGNFVRLQDL